VELHQKAWYHNTKQNIFQKKLKERINEKSELIQAMDFYSQNSLKTASPEKFLKVKQNKNMIIKN
jgi:hypothetical protein